MKEIIDFLYANPIGCLATVDDFGRPRVRPWKFMLEQDKKLWFCTSNLKDVFCQLQSNPAIEFCSASKDLVTVRVSGDVIFSIDMNIKEKMIENDDRLKSKFGSNQNTNFDIFYLKHGRAVMSDLSDNAPKIFDF